MAYHFIVIMSHYNKGYRVGWHYSSEDQLDKVVISSLMERIKKECGSIQFGIHKLSTDSTSTRSIVEKDSFFDDVIFTRDIDVFIDYVASDQKLTALDVAKFLLTIIPTSHLKLQKLIYYCYAEYLKKTGLKLFREPIVSYRYGPVVESVFQEFTEHGSSIIDYVEDEKFIISTNDTAATPSLIKIATSEHGTEAVDCILDTFVKYAELGPFELVDRTHLKGGPWDRVYKEGQNVEITDDLITKYQHIVE